jgi:pimeloyl-ACP methyl ester carboxylesterase
MQIKRSFVDVAEGQMHYRYCGDSTGDKLPLVMLHGGGGTSKFIEPLMRPLGETRRLIAFDLLGNGDSSPPTPEAPDVPYFAHSIIRALDEMGIQSFDLYGWHTGSNLSIEMAIKHSKRVRKMILDGVSLFSEADRADYVANYAPVVPITDYGSQLLWAWHFARDRFLFKRYFRKTRETRRDVEFPSAEQLHDITLEVLKGIRTYHHAYLASFKYRKEERIPLITIPTLVTASSADPLCVYVDRIATLVPGSVKVSNPGFATPPTAAETADIFTSYLDGNT